MQIAPSIQPREYQSKIIETCKSFNTLVVLPTGLGKTLIALYLAVHRKYQFPASRILILAPTRPLIDQHFQYFEANLPELFADIQLFTGAVPANERKKIFQTAEIIFSTPQCIANDIQKELYSLNEVSLLVIDEAHRCLKNYDYTKVVEKYKSQSQFPRILGLTASPGSDPDKVKQICTHLNIEKIEIRSRESEDVKPYLKEREHSRVEVPFPVEFQEIKVLLKRIFDSKTEKLKAMHLLFAPANKITLLKLQHQLAAKASPGNWSAMVGMSLTAQAIKISHAMELLETQTLSGLKEYLLGLKRQADEKKSKGVQTLVNSSEFRVALLSLEQLILKGIEHPKMEEIAVISENEFKLNKKAKIIIFTQFRETASKIQQRLSKIPEARPSIFVGQTKRKNSTTNIQTGLSQKEQKQIIEQFKSGEINVLIATSIGEEGLDIPEVNAVIFYEPIPSAIRKIQRSGRTARLSPGKIIMLMTKDTRDIAHHYASSAREKKMYKIIEQIKKELDEKAKNPSLNRFI